MKVIATRHGDVVVSVDRQRAFSEQPFGFAVYEAVARQGNDITFGNGGMVEDHKAALSWIRGESPTVVRIYPPEKVS